MPPFKFHFSKMSKSRSKESRSSVECDEPTCIGQTTSRSSPGTPAIENIGGVSMDTSNVRSSPPPSYEYVLEETRMGQKVSADEEQTESTSDTAVHQRNERGSTSIHNAIQPPAPEILHKSSKEHYRAVAKQFGITCKMSDHCRCFDCQSHYFDCEYDKDEQAKTDGGLSAGTPMFLAEVMHGTACVLL